MRKTLFVLLAVAIVGSAALANDDDGFGQNIAGAWLGEGTFSVDLGCDGVFELLDIAFKDAQMFGVGGDRVVTNPANPNSGLGTWEKTGPRQVTGRDINFSGNPPPPAPPPNTSVGLITIVVDFERGFENATTTFEGKFYNWDQDPLDPTEVPWGCSSGEHTSFRKVSATE